MCRPVLLVDTPNCAARAFFSHKGLTDSEGNGTGLMYGTLNELVALRQAYHCEDIVLVSDARSWRRDASSTYKANRHVDAEVRDELVRQTALLVSVCTAIGMLHVKSEGLEADDIISLACWANSRRDVYVLSNDKDLYQVLRPHVAIITPAPGGKHRNVHAGDVLEKFGIPCSLWAHYLAAGGETGDNIKAFRGIGPMTAAKLVQAGLRCHKPFSEQPAEVQQKLAKHAQDWAKLEEAFALVRLPRQVESKYLPERLRAGAAACCDAIASYRWRQTPTMLHDLTAFLSDHQMSTLLPKRRSFINATN